MKIAPLPRYALGLTAAGALLAACGSGVSSLAPSTPMQQSANGAHRGRSGSWMAPDAKSHDLLYISDQGNQAVYVYFYPSAKLQGTLTGFQRPVGECVDKAGNVFIVDETASVIFEYAHGGKSPIATLNDPGYSPAGCSVDPTTGSLAVTNYSSTSNGQGNVAIYKHPKGNPSAYYTDPSIARMFWCGYDGAGNLFVDGATVASTVAFAELPKGSTLFRDIKLNQPIQNPAGVQWDGKHMAVGDATTSVIYQFTIKGKNGTEVGTTPLIGGGNLGQFWIQGSQVVGPEPFSADAGIWNYPRGGPVKKTITGFNNPTGATISVVPK